MPTESGPELIQEFNDAVGRRDLDALSERIHEDVVWRHNIGVGSIEEGEYRGRESVLALFERILEGWEYLRAKPDEVQELSPGVFLIRGELQAKHRAFATEVVAPYEQRVELKDGLLIRGEMVSSATAHL